MAGNLSLWKIVIFSLTPLLVLLLLAELIARIAIGTGPPCGPCRSRKRRRACSGPTRISSGRWLQTSIGTFVEDGFKRIVSGSGTPSFRRSSRARFEPCHSARAVPFAQLGPLLEAANPGRSFTTINAGVSAYSSFQSLIYLELHGLDLEPDLVIFYHELNDYLPSTLRDSSQNELGVMQTDRQLHESRTLGVARLLGQRSALFRALRSWSAARNLESFDQARSTIHWKRLACRESASLRG